MKTEFEKELEQLINKHSMENESDTPDLILAGYLMMCLDAFNLAVRTRTKLNNLDKKWEDLLESMNKE